MLYLTGFPMPPPANNLYTNRPNRSGKQAGRMKSVEYKVFEHACMVWAMRKHAQLQAARELVTQCRQNRFIRIDQIFFFPRERILCKDGSPKRNDTANRLKALHDVIAKLILIDDCWFWCGAFDKTIMSAANSVGLPQHLTTGFVDVSLSIVDKPFSP